MKRAILVVDMVNDFVYDKYGSEGARDIIQNIETLLENAKENDTFIIYAQDNHSEDDPEMDIWGEHAMKGEEGSETIDELKGFEDILIEKNTYDPFFETELEKILEEHDIDMVIIAGVSTDICVQHTAGAAFFRGYDVVVLEDCTAAISEEKHRSALEYMKNMYAVEVKNSKDVMEES